MKSSYRFRVYRAPLSARQSLLSTSTTPIQHVRRLANQSLKSQPTIFLATATTPINANLISSWKSISQFQNHRAPVLMSARLRYRPGLPIRRVYKVNQIALKLLSASRRAIATPQTNAILILILKLSYRFRRRRVSILRQNYSTSRQVMPVQVASISRHVLRSQKRLRRPQAAINQSGAILILK